ncbi:glycosyltransferase family protein [Alteromonadaceae bacterium BrNp21-10]|nr:glycosyltransferase family protein [Alteromonadaceae bacterium BrNp21-10]
MKILYGIQGTGNGHITRARVMANAFAKRDDIEVDYFFSGRPADKYFDMQSFADYQCRQGMSFVTQNGAISNWQTFRQVKIGQLWRDIRQLDLSGYDLVINDFEPISAWAARRQKIPSISISHQAAFMHAVPKQGENYFNQLILKYFAPTDINLGVHWHHFGYDILPPFIQNQQIEGIQSNSFLVYLPFENLQSIKDLLEPLSECEFICFHPDIAEDFDESNIHWRKPATAGFHQVLRGCTGVIANGGFELSSECLTLGKKLLIKPLMGQFEQLSNALTLTQLGLCQRMDVMNTDELDQWISKPGNQRVRFPEDANLLIDWLKAKNWQDTHSLCKTLWEQVTYPESVQQQLIRYPALV